MQISPNMGLIKWDAGSDFFSHAQLAANIDYLDVHDHSPTKGVQIPTAGIQTGAITTSLIADLNVTNAKIQTGTIQLTKLTSTVQSQINVPAGTSLPGSPIDGQEFYYVADATNGVVWHLKYRAASASSYKWEFVGGPSLLRDNFSWDTTGSATYIQPLSTSNITLPVAGDYMARWGALISNGSATVSTGLLTVVTGTSAPSSGTGDPYAARFTSDNTQDASASTHHKFAGVSAGTVLSPWIRSGAATSIVFSNAFVSVWPIRVG